MGGGGDSILERGGKPRARTTAYRVLRFCERFPTIAADPKMFWTKLTDEEQCYYLGYEIIRESEEAVLRFG